MLAIYRRLWQVKWAEKWQYRASLLMYVAYGLVSPVIYLAVWTTAAGRGSIQGLTAGDLRTYYLTLLVVSHLTTDVTIYFLAPRIQDGTLAGHLLNPIHPVWTAALIFGLAEKALQLVVLVPVWGILCLLFRPDYGAVTAGSVAAGIPAVALGFAVSFLLGATLSSIAFWTTRVWFIMRLYESLTVVFAGQFAPLAFMPGAVRSVAQYLPFQLYSYFPIQVILRLLSPAETLRGYLVGVAWLAVSLLCFRWVWRRGTKRFSAVGA